MTVADSSMNMVDGLEIMSQGSQQQPWWAGTQWADTTSHPVCESGFTAEQLAPERLVPLHTNKQPDTQPKGKRVQPGIVHTRIQMSHVANVANVANVAHSYTSISCSVCM